MMPATRPERVTINPTRSCITDDLERAAADISTTTYDMKMIMAGYSKEAIRLNVQAQSNFIAFGETKAVPKTISEKVRMNEAQKL